EFKIFDPDLRNKHFVERINSPNGEDYLYVFHNIKKGTYVLMHYNLIEQKVNTPIICHGFTLFPNGELAYFRAEEEPTKHHLVQLWQTPFVAGEQVPSEYTDSYLYKVGNKDIVRAMAEAYEILILVGKDDSYSDLYNDLAKKCTDILDSYYWIDKQEAFSLHEPLLQIQATASAAIEEYEKKLNIQRNTEAELERVRTAALDLFQKVQRQSFDSVDLFVEALAQLRKMRGQIISLRELRYNDPELIEQLEEEAVIKSEKLSEDCVRFLLEPDALAPYLAKIEGHQSFIAQVKTAKEAEELEEAIDHTAEELQLLIDIVSNLKIEDATQTTRIIDNISSMYASLNQVKAGIKRKLKDLMGTEAQAEFGAQLKLLDQGLINFLDVATTPEKCDDFLTKLMVQVEELESKFSNYDGFVETLAEKREGIYTAFEQRKKQLVEALNNRTASLVRAAERILSGVKTRMSTLNEVSEINGFFAADLMIEKVRDIIQQLTDLNDNNKADGLQAQLKTIKEESIRQLRDRKELFVDGKNVLRFGKHAFSVNVQPLDLTIVQQDGELYYHLTGTNFFERIEDEQIAGTKEIWNQALISENEALYRAEYLAYQLFKEGVGKEIDPVDLQGDSLESSLLEEVQQAAATRFNEGYTKGIHDEDAAQILQALLHIHSGIGLLAFSPNVRAFAHLIWERFLPADTKALLTHQLESAQDILAVFPNTHEFDYLIEEIRLAMKELSL
ncbi:MAG: DNA repair ATPase, partial [Bacteroidota bacterium]